MQHEVVALEQPESRAVVRRMADVQRERIEWLWPGRIPQGKVSMLVGDPGLGKSMVTTAIAAAVSHGARWPVQAEGNAPLGDTLVLSAEDDPGDTIRPRLEAAGADLDRVRVLDGIQDVADDGRPTLRPWSLADLPDLDVVLGDMPGCRLVIIDPISAYLAGIDSHKNADVRALLAPLADLAARHNVAILCVSHLNKSGGPAIYRTSGSLAFVAAARSVYAVSKDKDDHTRRLVVPVKANLAPDAGGLAYRIGTDADDVPCIEWEPEPVEVDADEALDSAEDAETRSIRQEATEWLKEQLEDGPVRVQEVMKDAKALGFTVRTLQRARRDIGAKVEREEFGGKYRWSLPCPPSHARQTRSRHLGEHDETLGTQDLEPDSDTHARQPATRGEHGEHDGDDSEVIEL